MIRTVSHPFNLWADVDEACRDLSPLVEKLDPAHTADRLGDLEIVHRWWRHMEDLMETNADGSPVAVSLREVFHLD